MQLLSWIKELRPTCTPMRKNSPGWGLRPIPGSPSRGEAEVSHHPLLASCNACEHVSGVCNTSVRGLCHM